MVGQTLKRFNARFLRLKRIITNPLYRDDISTMYFNLVNLYKEGGYQVEVSENQHNVLIEWKLDMVDEESDTFDGFHGLEVYYYILILL